MGRLSRVAGFTGSGPCSFRYYWQTTFPSCCVQNSTFPVQRSSRCTPIDDETICHLKSIANEITMSTVATMTVAGIREFIAGICPRHRQIQSQIGLWDLILASTGMAQFFGAQAAPIGEPLAITKAIPTTFESVYGRGRGWGWGAHPCP